MSKGEMNRLKLNWGGSYSVLFPLGGCAKRNSHTIFSCFSQNFSSFLHEVFPNDPSCNVSGIYQKKMALVWREREDEEKAPEGDEVEKKVHTEDQN